ncbi:MAG: hypothetical protein AAGI71_16575 [Bacteroidota bacterium]
MKVSPAPLERVPVDRADQPTKKAHIVALYEDGCTEIEDLARRTGARPSYVASVLQQAGYLNGYFDLYTSTGAAMNVYTKFFQGRLGFKDVATARRSVALIDRQYRAFEVTRDRAGQHHALMMAMTMFNRARWTGKERAAEVFRRWLVDRIGAAAPEAAPMRKAA